MVLDIKLTDSDLDQVRKDLNSKRPQMEPREIQFVELLIQRAEAAKANRTQPASAVMWTWTYRF